MSGIQYLNSNPNAPRTVLVPAIFLVAGVSDICAVSVRMPSKLQYSQLCTYAFGACKKSLQSYFNVHRDSHWL